MFKQPELQDYVKNSKFPALFVQNSNGNTMIWCCWIKDNKFYRASGVTTGKIREPTLKIFEGNTVKSPQEQALFEAEKSWISQLSKGYKPADTDKEGLKIYNRVLDQKANNGGINRGIRLWGETAITPATTAGKQNTKKHTPMLAKSYLDQVEKVKFPAIVQAKVDGMRCMAYMNSDSEIILESREGNSYMFLDHIRDELQDFFKMIKNKDLVLDGELYVHTLFRDENGELTLDAIPNRELKGVERYQFLSKACKTSLKKANSLEMFVEYWVFDIFHLEDSFETRWARVEKYFEKYEGDILKLVPTVQVNSHEEIEEKMKELIGENDSRAGYEFEGIMIRDPKAKYVSRAKYHSNVLLKYKRFQDEEWELNGAEECDGNQRGAVKWVCIKKVGGKILKCTAKQIGNLEESKQMFLAYKKSPKKFIGKMITLRYNEKTKDGVPRFPRAVGIREEM